MHVSKEMYFSLVEKMIEQIRMSGKRFTGVYGVPRGGTLIAYIVSEKLGIPLLEKPDSRCCVVDDLIDSGETMKKFDSYAFHVLIDKRQIEGSEWIEFWYEQGEGKIEDNIRRIIQSIGEDQDREGLKETPKRVAKAYEKLFEGYSKDPKQILNTTFAGEGYDEIVLLKDIEFYSTCEHHMLPFYGKCHVAYIPSKKVVGISKLARLVEVYSRRLQIQERMTDQISSAINEHLQPLGVAVIVEGIHLCTRARGIEKQNNVMITSSMKGKFRTNPSARVELMRLISNGK